MPLTHPATPTREVLEARPGAAGLTDGGLGGEEAVQVSGASPESSRWRSVPEAGGLLGHHLGVVRPVVGLALHHPMMAVAGDHDEVGVVAFARPRSRRRWRHVCRVLANEG